MKENLMEAKDLKPKEEAKEKIQEEKNHEENNKVKVIKEEAKKKEMKKEEIKQSEEVESTQAELEKKQDERDIKKEEIKKEESEQIKSDNTETNKKQDTEKENKKVKRNIEEQKKSKEKNKHTQKKEKRQKENKPKKDQTKKMKKIIISFIIFAIVILIFSTVFALANINNEKIISGVTIEGVEVSGLTKEEAMANLETLYSEKMQNNIMLQYGEFESELNSTLMEVNYDIEKAVNEAYSLGRDGNIFVNNYNILGTLIGKRDFDVSMTMNEEIAKQTINDIGANLPGIMIESSYSIEEDELIITRGKEGVVINTETLLTEVKEMINDIHETENVIEIPVETKTPQEIDIDKIHSEIYQEAKDAYYTKEPFTVYPEVEGIDFDVEKAKEIIAAEVKDEYVIELIITKPAITIEAIGTEAFPDRLSTFSTRYDASDKDRTTNLIIACQKLNGKVIMPGETFSYNATLGPRTYAAGYKNGKVYENGQVVDGIGGGICQISSTLYNAALMSDMEIVERRNHQFVTSYVSEGRDATVVYGITDFKFKNTRTYPIRLVASAKGGVATVSVFGIKEADREYTYSFRTDKISTIPYTTKYVEDSSLATGQEVVTQKGANGLVCKTYMTKMLNGKVVSTTLLSTDTYSAMQRIVKRGVSKTTSSQTTPSTTTTTTPTTITEDTMTTETPTTSPSTETSSEQTDQTSTDTGSTSTP